MSTDTTSTPFPATRREDLVENLHGRSVPDPYRWLEDPDSAETRSWVSRQNEFTQTHLARLPARQAIAEIVARVASTPAAGAPRKIAGRYFVSTKDGAQNQDVWRIADSLEEFRDGGQIVVDPNEWSEEGTTAVTRFEIAPDAGVAACVVSEGGSDWSEYRLFDTATGDRVPDARIQSKSLPPTWLPDSRSYVYAAPLVRAGLSGSEPDALGHWRLMRHRVGTPAESDQVLLEDPLTPTTVYLSTVSHDHRWLIVSIVQGTAQHNRLWVYPLHDEHGETVIGDPLGVVDADTASFDAIRMAGSTLLCRTDLDSDAGRVVAVDLDAVAATGEVTFAEVIAPSQGTLVEVIPAGDELIAAMLVDARPRLERYDVTGRHLGELIVPAGEPLLFGSWWASPDSDEYFITWSTPTRPSFPLRGVAGEDTLALVDDVIPTVAQHHTPSEVEVRQQWAASADGTRVPYVIVNARARSASGPMPTLLYGYGGFGLSLGMRHDPTLAGWIEAGGTVAIAALRGGGEFGTAWHDAGRGANKQNVFDDCIAVAEHLVATGTTRPDGLVLHGTSNGGLLVGAVLTQRPDLVAVALPDVGVLDMLRFHRFTFGGAWIPDYGDPDVAEDFETLLAYSPVHNAGPAKYPPTLITTGDHDDRVVPSHSHKFTSALQHAQQGSAPILTRVETAGGHGAGKSKERLVAQVTDVLAFAAHHAGLVVR